MKEPADWMAKPPAAAYCYQEYDPATRKFLTACHFSQTNCQTARGANNEKPGTGCAFTDLGKAVWNPHPGGYLRSWYQFWDGEVGDPFPQIDPALLAKAKAAAGSN